jgi:hypothetical protein
LFISVAYALPYYQPNGYYSLDSKPYVYRQLSLWIISILQDLGLRYETASLLFIGASGVAFVFALVFLMKELRH